jgi:hypothetical protein
MAARDRPHESLIFGKRRSGTRFPSDEILLVGCTGVVAALRKLNTHQGKSRLNYNRNLSSLITDLASIKTERYKNASRLNMLYDL